MHDDGHGKSHGYAKSEAPKRSASDDNPRSDETESSKTNKVEKLEKRIEVDQWIMIGLTAAIALAGFLQWPAISGQLDEMKSSGIQSDRRITQLIDQATAQANAAKAQSEQAAKQTTVMSQFLSKTDALIKATNGLALQAKREADLTRDNFIRDQRPYVAFRPEPSSI